MSAKISKALARKIAADIEPDMEWSDIRDLCDLWTGDLDTWQLDRLTDWVAALVSGE